MEYIKRGQSFISLTCKLFLFVLKDVDFIITPERATENPRNVLLNWNPNIESCRNVAVGALWWALPSSDTHKKKQNVCKNKPNPTYNYFWNLLAMTGKPIKCLRHSSVVVVWQHGSAQLSPALASSGLQGDPCRLKPSHVSTVLSIYSVKMAEPLPDD